MKNNEDTIYTQKKLVWDFSTISFGHYLR